MLKTAILISAVALSAPAFAQDMTQTTPQSATTAPTQSTTPTTPQAQTPSATPAPSGQTDTTTAAATTESATPVTGTSQIAQVVDTEFPTYDKNTDNNLNRTEFGAWMVALKTASDPATKPTDPATKKWVDGAFVSADADKSKTVSKTELTKYLSQGAD